MLCPCALDDAMVNWESDRLESDQCQTPKQQDPPQCYLIMQHPSVAASKQVDQQEGLHQPGDTIEDDAGEQQTHGEFVGSFEAARNQTGIEHKLVDGKVVQDDIHLSAMTRTDLL